MMLTWNHNYGRDQEAFQVGDRVRVKSDVPSYAGRAGVVTSLDFGVTVRFSDGVQHTYDDDMLTKVETK